MPTLLAEELIDQRRLTRERARWAGSRVYRVNSRSVDTVLLGDGSGPPLGLPAVGDPWDLSALPYCVVVKLEPVLTAGTNTDNTNNTNGWTEVRAHYATPTGGDLPPPSTLAKFTRVAPTVGQVQAYFGVDPETGQRVPGDAQINNGGGTSQDVGLVDYEVFVGLNPSQFASVDRARLTMLHTNQSLNREASVSLPPYLQSSTFDTFGKGQLRFRGYTFDDPDGAGNRFLRIMLAARTDHVVRWAVAGPDGEATGAEGSAFTYVYDDFAGLW